MAEFFRKLFGDKSSPSPIKQIDSVTTAPISDQQIASIINNQNVQYETQQLIAASGQSVGKLREHNEDSLVAITATLAGNTASGSMENGGLWTWTIVSTGRAFWSSADG